MDDAIVLRTIPQMMQVSVKSVEEITKIMLEILAQHKENKFVNELLKYGKLGGNLDFEICKSFAVRDYDSKLTQHGIAHAIVYDKVSGLTTIVTRDIDREAVLKAKNELFVEQKRLTRLSPDEFSRLNSGKNIEIIRGYNVVDAKLFQQVAKKYGLVNIAFQKNSDDPEKIDIYYTAKDKVKASLVMNKVAYSTVGLSGELASARIAREINFQSALIKDVQKAENNFYVVSHANPEEYIHFNKDGLQYYKNGRLVRDEARSSNHFVSTSKSYISSIVSPLRFSKEEFEVSSEVRNEMIKKVRIGHDSDEFDKHRLAIEQSAKQLIALKLSEDRDNSLSIPKEFYSLESSVGTVFKDIKSVVNDQKSQEIINKIDALKLADKAMIKNYVGRELPVIAALSRDIQNTNQEFYIVANKNGTEYLHFSQNGYEHIKGGSIIDRCARDNERFNNLALEKTLAFRAPMALKKEEFEVSRDELIKTLRSSPSALDAQKLRVEQLEKIARELIEKKLSLDNGEQVQIPSSFYNNQVSFREFIDIERINDEESKELIDTMDRLEDKEKLLVKNYIKDAFEKVHSIEVQSAYIDPAIKEDDLETATAHQYDEEIDMQMPYDDEIDFEDPYTGTDTPE